MSSNLAVALDECLVALALPLDAGQRRALLEYLTLLQRWNAVYNLTAVRDHAAMLTHHLADCLAVIAPLTRVIDGRRATLLDVGSGGGLPGIVVAIAMPAISVTTVDTVGKKAAFVQQVAAELRLPNLGARHARVERLQAATFDVVASRAFATLSAFASLTRACLSADGCWMAMKGRVPSDEISALPADVDVFHVEQLSVPGLDAERCLVWMRPRP